MYGGGGSSLLQRMIVQLHKLRKNLLVQQIVAELRRIIPPFFHAVMVLFFCVSCLVLGALAYLFFCPVNLSSLPDSLRYRLEDNLLGKGMHYEGGRIGFVSLSRGLAFFFSDFVIVNDHGHFHLHDVSFSLSLYDLIFYKMLHAKVSVGQLDGDLACRIGGSSGEPWLHKVAGPLYGQIPSRLLSFRSLVIQDGSVSFCGENRFKFSADIENMRKDQLLLINVSNVHLLNHKGILFGSLQVGAQSSTAQIRADHFALSLIPVFKTFTRNISGNMNLEFGSQGEVLRIFTDLSSDDMKIVGHADFFSGSFWRLKHIEGSGSHIDTKFLSLLKQDLPEVIQKAQWISGLSSLSFDVSGKLLSFFTKLELFSEKDTVKIQAKAHRLVSGFKLDSFRLASSTIHVRGRGLWQPEQKKIDNSVSPDGSLQLNVFFSKTHWADLWPFIHPFLVTQPSVEKGLSALKDAVFNRGTFSLVLNKALGSFHTEKILFHTTFDHAQYAHESWSSLSHSSGVLDVRHGHMVVDLSSGLLDQKIHLKDGHLVWIFGKRIWMRAALLGGGTDALPFIKKYVKVDLEHAITLTDLSKTKISSSVMLDFQVQSSHYVLAHYRSSSRVRDLSLVVSPLDGPLLLSSVDVSVSPNWVRAQAGISLGDGDRGRAVFTYYPHVVDDAPHRFILDVNYTSPVIDSLFNRLKFLKWSFIEKGRPSFSLRYMGVTDGDNQLSVQGFIHKPLFLFGQYDPQPVVKDTEFSVDGYYAPLTHDLRFSFSRFQGDVQLKTFMGAVNREGDLSVCIDSIKGLGQDIPHLSLQLKKGDLHLDVQASEMNWNDTSKFSIHNQNFLSSTDFTNKIMDIQVKKLLLSGVAFRDFDFRLGYSQKRYDHLSSSVFLEKDSSEEKPYMKIALQENQEGRTLQVDLRTLDFFSRLFLLGGYMEGGSFHLNAVENLKDHSFKGFAFSDKLTLNRAPSGSRFLSFLSLTGLFSALTSSQVHLYKVSSNFIYHPDCLIFEDFKAYNASVGVTGAGKVDLSSPEYNLSLSGEVMPVYMFNQLLKNLPIVGTLLAGKSLIGSVYDVKGTLAVPLIHVHSVSFMMPGFLKSMFFKNTLDSHVLSHLEKKDPLDPVKKADSLDSTKKTDSLDPAKKADSLDSAKKADSLDPAKKADSLDSAKKADSLDPAKKADSLDSAKKTDSLDPAKKADSLDPVKKTDSLDPVKKTDSLDPVKKADSLDPAKKADSLDSAKKADSLDSVNQKDGSVSQESNQDQESRMHGSYEDHHKRVA